MRIQLSLFSLITKVHKTFDEIEILPKVLYILGEPFADVMS